MSQLDRESNGPDAIEDPRRQCPTCEDGWIVPGFAECDACANGWAAGVPELDADARRQHLAMVDEVRWGRL